jgi:hypothetical protein
VAFGCADALRCRWESNMAMAKAEMESHSKEYWAIVFRAQAAREAGLHLVIRLTVSRRCNQGSRVATSLPGLSHGRQWPAGSGYMRMAREDSCETSAPISFCGLASLAPDNRRRRNTQRRPRGERKSARFVGDLVGQGRAAPMGLAAPLIQVALFRRPNVGKIGSFGRSRCFLSQLPIASYESAQGANNVFCPV